MRSLCVFLSLTLAFSAVHGQNLVLELDGDGDFVELPPGIFAGLREATIECWARWDKLGFYSQVFGFGQPLQVMALSNYAVSATAQFFLYNSRRELHLIQAANLLQTGRWYHLAAVTGPGGMKLYVNGVLVGEDEYEGSFAAVGNSDQNYLGRPHWEQNADFCGAVDEVRVWRLARTRAQIRANMHRRLSGREAGLVALWSFDAGDGQDASASASHGQLRGDARPVPARLPGPEELYCPAVVHGTIADPAGQPIGGATVILERPDARIATRADEHGRYGLTATEGKYDLSATSGELGAWKLDLELLSGEQHRADLDLRPAVSVEGMVLEADGTTPQAGARVEAVRAEDMQVRALAHSDARGQYRFVNLRPGRYRFRCRAPGGTAYFGAGPQGDVVEVASDRSRAGVDLLFHSFQRGTWKSYTVLDGLAANSVQGVYQAADGMLWIGTEGGGLSSFDGEVFTSYTAADGLGSNYVRAICQGTDGMLWICTLSRLSSFDGEEFTPYNVIDDPTGNWVRAVYPSADGKVWIGTEGAGLSRYDGEVFTTYTVADGLAGNHVWAICQGADGRMWIGTSTGLSAYDGQAFTTYTVTDGLASDEVTAIYGAADGTL